MEISLKGKIALITGSSRGIGLEIAEAFGSAGAKVAICARQQREINAALGRLRKAKIECIGVAVDLEKAGSEKTTLKRVLKEWGAIDILVNNVGGITQTGRFEDLSDRDWLDSISLNLMPTVRFCRVAIPYLLQSTTPRIINIASMVAAQPGSYNPHYSASKAAIVNLTKHLSGIYGKQRLLVNCISPGIIHTEGWDEYIFEKAKDEKIPLSRCKRKENRRAVKFVPLGRLGHGKEVASLAAFLASDHAAFITGSNYRVDGGRVQSAS